MLWADLAVPWNDDQFLFLQYIAYWTLYFFYINTGVEIYQLWKGQSLNYLSDHTIPSKCYFNLVHYQNWIRSKKIQFLIWIKVSPCSCLQLLSKIPGFKSNISFQVCILLFFRWSITSVTSATTSTLIRSIWITTSKPSIRKSETSSVRNVNTPLHTGMYVTWKDKISKFSKKKFYIHA